MRLVRRILALAAISVAGIALLAPLAARSAAPMAPVIEEHLLTVDDAPTVAADRGTLSSRGGGAFDVAEATDRAEALDGGPMPTPASAPMEATLHSTATPPTAAVPAAPAPVTSSGSSVWDDLARCESGGNWAINTGNGYYGGLQFSYDTWHGYGGGEFADYPHQANREEQIVVAERLRAERGYAPWPACRAKLGLP
ncbi:MAG TPA: transglycosylase family protein [Candidatus Limnocylindria bacterium]